MQTALICLELVARLNRVDIDLRTAVRQHAFGEAELAKEELLRLAKHLGFTAKLKELKSWKVLGEKYPLLCLTNNLMSYC